MIFTNKPGLIRLYDSASTPVYLQLKFDLGDANFPMGTPKTEEKLMLHRGNMNSDSHFVEGSDEPMMESVAVTFSLHLEDTSHTGYVLDWIDAMNDGGSTQVNSHTLETDQADTKRDGTNDNVAFADSNKLTCKVEVIFDTSGTDMHWEISGVYFAADQQGVGEAEDAVTLSLNGMCYGTIVHDTSAFTEGTDVTA